MNKKNLRIKKILAFNFRLLLFFNLQIIILFFFQAFNASSQSITQYNPRITRILFVLDCSGSMVEKMEGKSKFETSKQLLYHLADSIEKSNDKVEFGLRMYGHQYNKSVHNCEDSKLEIPFGKNNAPKIRALLDKTTPQGYTPIAYSLFQATNDFPNDANVKNAIVLITDGLETCEGDPCAVSVQLEKKRIVLKPFVIGLGVGNQGKSNFDCVGYYYDANTESSFQNVLNVVVSQAMNTTTVQVNLLNSNGESTETETAMSFYDFHSGTSVYNLVHSMDEKGNPDTLSLSPVGRYNLLVHSIPSVTKKNIELIPGKHNVIAVDVPQGSLNVQMENLIGFTDAQCIVREVNTKNILHVQDMNTTIKYLVGEYDLEILTLPRIEHKSIFINQSRTTEVKVPIAGTLTLTSSWIGVAGIYCMIEDKLTRIYELHDISTATKMNLNLQPGEYKIIFRPNKERQSVLTQIKTFQIISGQVTNVKL